MEVPSPGAARHDRVDGAARLLLRYSVALWMREPDGMTYEEILLYYVIKSRYARNIATVDRAAFQNVQRCVDES